MGLEDHFRGGKRINMSSSTPPPKPTFEELLSRAQDIVDHRSRSYVEDAFALSRWMLVDGKQLLDNLTATQMRCTQLLEENRRLKSKVDTQPDLDIL
jgi:hypothetical protein